MQSIARLLEQLGAIVEGDEGLQAALRTVKQNVDDVSAWERLISLARRKGSVVTFVQGYSKLRKFAARVEPEGKYYGAEEGLRIMGSFYGDRAGMMPILAINPSEIDTKTLKLEPAPAELPSELTEGDIRRQRG